jgi:rhodanese-related sulfurtransferase
VYRDISVTDLANWRASAKDFVLLDVREPDEIATASIAGSLNIPMRDIPLRVGELDKTKTIAVLCHYGGRSARVAQFLGGHGFADVHNVDGGIDAYAQDVDPSLPRY